MRIVLRLLLASFMTVALGLTVASAAGLTVTTGGLVGSGTGVVTAPPVEVTDVHWVYQGADPPLLQQVKVTFDSAVIDDFDVYVFPKDGTGVVLGSLGKTETLGGGPVEVPFNLVLQAIPVADIEQLSVLVCYHTTPDSLPAKVCRTP